MLEDDDKLHFIKRVRYVDDIPVCVEEIYMPVKQLPDLSLDFFTEEGLTQSTYHVLQKHYNIVIKHVDDIMSAEIAGDKDSILLDVPSSSPVLLRQRVSYDSFDRPLSYSNGRYIIEISFSFKRKHYLSTGGDYERSSSKD